MTSTKFETKPLFTRRQLTALLLPLIAEQALSVTIGLADTLMVSSVGEAAVSGVSLVDTFNTLSRGGLGISEKSASSPEAPLLGATATTAASGGNREELLGQRPARCKRQRSRRWVPQPGLVCKAD